jgi:ribonuclease HI
MIKYSKILQTLPNGKNVVRIFTDGSASWSDRTGGYAYLIEYKDEVQAKNLNRSYAAGESQTTVSRMELKALVQALESLGGAKHIVEVVTDSEYLAKSGAFWIESWARSGWKVKNSDLLKDIYEWMNIHEVYFTKVPGHSGVLGNETVDQLASAARRTLLDGV